MKKWMKGTIAIFGVLVFLTAGLFAYGEIVTHCASIYLSDIDLNVFVPKGISDYCSYEERGLQDVHAIWGYRLNKKEEQTVEKQLDTSWERIDFENETVEHVLRYYTEDKISLNRSNELYMKKVYRSVLLCIYDKTELNYYFILKLI